MSKIINRVLRFFGLLTISHARSIFIELTALRERDIMHRAEDDFGAVPLQDFEKRIREWSSEAFKQAIEDDRNPVWLVGEWEFPITRRRTTREPSDR